MHLVFKLAKFAALGLALYFSYLCTFGAGAFNLHYAWKLFLFNLAQASFFMGIILMMVSGFVMMSAGIFGSGAVKVSITMFALGTLMVVVTALEGNEMCIK